jgi:hypothetical protein
MIRKYLMLTLKEDVLNGDDDAMSFMTKLDGGVTINVPSQKLGIRMDDLKEAIKAIEDFNAGNPIKQSIVEIVKSNVGSDNTMHNFEFKDDEHLNDIGDQLP